MTVLMKTLLAYWIVINLVGLYVMYRDKQRAKTRQYRIPEATLWRVAIIGGAVGTTIGMHWFRHKTKHVAFRLGFPLLAIIDIAIVLWLLLSLRHG